MTVSELHGRETTDALLIEIARRFRAASREGDLFARLGATEFALATPNARDGRQLAAVDVRREVAAGPEGDRAVQGDLVTGDRRAAPRQPDHHVVEALDVDAGGGPAPARSAGRDRQLLLGLALRQLPATDGLVELGEHLGPQEGRSEQLVVGAEARPLPRKEHGHVRSDDVPRHGAQLFRESRAPRKDCTRSISWRAAASSYDGRVLSAK